MSAPSFLNGKSSPPPQRPTKANKLGRAKKPNNKNPKKLPQRGMGVFKLERLMLQERQKMTEIKSVNQTQYLPISPETTVAEMVPLGGYPVQWNYALGGPTISGGFWSGQGNLLDLYGSGASERMGFNDDHPLVLESSKELPPIPNLSQFQSQSLLLDCCCNNSSCYKKKRTNQENNGDYKLINPETNFSMSDSEFLGLSLGNSINGRIEGVEAPYKLNDQGLELVTVHRRAMGIMGGSVVMEYDFLPGNSDRSTPSKELPGFPIEAAASASSSVLDGGGETSYNAAFTTGASNSVDLSLKLSF